MISVGKKAVKFGGTSLCDAAQMKKAAEIVRSDASREIIVVSAPGKRTPKDEKITDLLLRMEKTKTLEERRTVFSLVRERFDSLIRSLMLPLDFSEEYEDIFWNASGDLLISRGEYFCARIFAALLNYRFTDAADTVFFGKDGMIDTIKTREKLGKEILAHRRVVIPGFYGRDADGKIKTFPRGGSDITGAIAADAADAAIYENFTDVSGFLLADPKIVSAPMTVPALSYGELRRLSSMGATVLHADSILPLYEKKIPVVICNTNDPSGSRTYITEKKTTRAIAGIVGQKGYTLFSVSAPNIGEDISESQKLFSLFECYTKSVYATPRTVDACGFLVRSADISEQKEEIVQALRSAFRATSVTIKESMALLSIVGEEQPLQCAKLLFETMEEMAAYPLLLDGGADSLGITVGFEEDHLAALIRRLYEKLRISPSF